MSITDRFVTEQIAALRSARFELGVLDGDKEQMQIRPVAAAAVARLVPWLRWSNAEGRHIYVRPAGAHRMTLVDDLTAEAIMQMQMEGFEPSYVVETSPDNFQAWLDNGQILEHALSTRVARLVAERFGADTNSADWRHFGRLAGFTNRKPKYRNARGLFPFVRPCPVDAPVEHYSEAPALRIEAQRQLAAEAAEAERQRAERAAAAQRPGAQRAAEPLPIERFWRDGRYGGDFTRADLAWCVHALGRGASVPYVEHHLGSRDLSHKGSAKRQQEYIDRTVRKALEHLGS